MCRHVAYLGPPVSLRSLLIDPPHSLYRQAWAPRRQRHGTVNADGFGIGWYAGSDPVPARYRRGVPIWGDPSLPDIARVTSSAAVLAAVRSATEGTAAGEQAAAPFAHGRWLFSHNGRLDGWPDSAAALLAEPGAVGPGAGGPCAGRDDGGHDSDGLGDAESVGDAFVAGPSALGLLLSAEAMVDSAFLWALALQRLLGGDAMDAALAGTIAAVEAAGRTGRFNFLLTDGQSIAATACGDTLWYRSAAADTPEPASGRESRDRAPDGSGTPAAWVLVASEPGDDAPGWTEVPDRHLLTATPSRVSIRPLAACAVPDGARPAGTGPVTARSADGSPAGTGLAGTGPAGPELTFPGAAGSRLAGTGRGGL